MKSFIATITVLILTLGSFGMVPAYAQEMGDGDKFYPNYTTTPPPNPNYTTTGGANKDFPKIGNPLKAESVEKLLFSFVDIMIFIGVILAVLTFIFIGFKFVMAQGNEDALKEAKHWFLYAVIGTAILIGAKAIVTVIENTLTASGVVKEDLFHKK